VGGMTHLLRLYVWREAFRKPGKLARIKEMPGEETPSVFSHPAQPLYESL
jgi:hypothetical protein